MSLICLLLSLCVIPAVAEEAASPDSPAADSPVGFEGFWILEAKGMRNKSILRVDRDDRRLSAEYTDQFGGAVPAELQTDGNTLSLRIERDIDGRMLALQYLVTLKPAQHVLRGTLSYEFDGQSPKQVPVTARRADERELRRRRQRRGISYGPFLGHLTSQSVRIWYRAAEPGDYLLTVGSTAGGEPRTLQAAADPANDLCVVWTVTDLQPEQTYEYQVQQGDRLLAKGGEYRFRTPPPADSPQQTRLAFASCAAEDAGTRRAWVQMEKQDPQTVVLLGDTPYIDTTELAVQRMRYGQFAAVPEFSRLLTSRPLYGTWDDHDFGRNDTDGRLTGKENSRQAFVEYHALESYGDGSSGIYTNFRRGGIEVFLLDARTWAGTEPSPADPQRPTLLGKAQWEWLKQRLQQSTAPFKILASGMIWNGATRPNKTDHWMHYPYERAALFRFLKEAEISGVVLVGGDIHRTRALRHSTADVVGYDLLELITSPMHDSIIEAANAPHPDLLFDAGEPHSFLIVECDTERSPAVLSARFLNAAGDELYSVTETAR